MENNISKEKIVSMNILFYFTESIILQYHLEDDVVKKIPELEKKLKEAHQQKDFLSARTSLKFLYSNNEDGAFPPTIILRKILTDLINKKISYEEIPIVIEKNLNIPAETAIQISEEIKNNPTVLKERKLEQIETPENQNAYDELNDFINSLGLTQVAPKPQQIRGMNQDLL